MAYKAHILLGKITKVHGYEGAVTIRLERNLSENIPGMESVFIETDGRPVPFFIDYTEQPDPLTLRLKFSDYKSTEKVREFVGCRVYLTGPAQLLTPAQDPNSLNGYDVFSEEDISIGIIAGIIENPGQLLLNIKSVSGKEILLPFHEDLINSIDPEKKIIRMIIPDGIADIN
jgi:16S rRNA processing protein RimM